MIDGWIGKFDPILKVGVVQHMNFTKDNNGLFYMLPNKYIKLKGGNLVDSTFRTISKSILLQKLYDKLN